ncbi:MAG: hypothetical protein KDD66_06415 [Bdellovibrionales bacterium]|nr:hypothetical protein [Bdellovibrionales bacterium]
MARTAEQLIAHHTAKIDAIRARQEQDAAEEARRKRIESAPGYVAGRKRLRTLTSNRAKARDAGHVDLEWAIAVGQRAVAMFMHSIDDKTELPDLPAGKRPRWVKASMLSGEGRELTGAAAAKVAEAAARREA